MNISAWSDRVSSLFNLSHRSRLSFGRSRKYIQSASRNAINTLLWKEFLICLLIMRPSSLFVLQLSPCRGVTFGIFVLLMISKVPIKGLVSCPRILQRASRRAGELKRGPCDYITWQPALPPSLRQLFGSSSIGVVIKCQTYMVSAF